MSLKTKIMNPIRNIFDVVIAFKYLQYKTILNITFLNCIKKILILELYNNIIN